MNKEPIYALAVDDDEGDLALVRLALERDGVRVTTATSGRQARQRLAEGSYEVLLVDLRLPDEDGIELLQAAREKDPHAVAIVLTAYSSTQAAVQAMRQGAYDFLTKPCSAEVLAAAVRRGAERHRLARALAARTRELETLNQDLDRRVQESTREIFFLNERLKRFIVQIMEANDARVKFMDNITHELKNPLSVVWGHAAHMLSREKESWTKDELEASLKAIFRNADSLNGLLEELMEAARLSGHKVKLDRETLHAYREARDAAHAFEPQAKAKGVTIACAYETGEGPTMEADKRRLGQVLSNLISNALKFTPAGGTITVSAKPSGTSVHFCVEDTGPGIAAEDASRIFDRFYQVETKQKHKGLGLGLEITKGLVVLHGGTIWVESELGKGAKFHFTIPCNAPTKDSPDTPVPQSIGKAH